MHLEGFTTRIPFFMKLSDFFIVKPGPGSISEALAEKLPVIIDCNAWTLPQERYNAQWLTEKRLGIALNSFEEIASGVRQLLDDSTFNEFQTNAREYCNRALFEVPVILDEVFERSIPYSIAAAAFAQSMEWNDSGAVWAAL